MTLRGRVASLLEVGTGFHPELTGRENIYLNGAILGMTRPEIRRKFDEIVAFAEVEKFLDTPVKHYSSGMYVRLAFVIAAHLEPEILIVDEVLAVGDTEFQKKCLGRMSEVAGAGRTVLFVSHNMAAVEALCARSIRLADGSLKDDGDTARVVAGYLRDRPARTDAGSSTSKKIENGLALESLDLSSSLVRIGDPIDIHLNFRAYVPGRLQECALLLHYLHGPRVAIVDLRPRRYIEVGSGLSTYYCGLAAERNAREHKPLHITCIEPYPFEKLRTIPGIKLLAKEVQDVDISLFRELQENDILFIDSSHILRFPCRVSAGSLNVLHARLSLG